MIRIDDLQGHWRRDWYKSPLGNDTETRVHWLQVGTIFADLRIPVERPDTTERTCLADFDQSELLMLMGADGFAGHITVEDDKCTWHPEINWHGVPEEPDIGFMSFDSDGGLFEEGVLANYSELWQLVPQAPLRALKVSCESMTGVLIENDDLFLLGIGPHPTGTSADLIKDLERRSAVTADLQSHFASEYVFGTWEGTHGIATLSTNPFHEGQVALERGEGRLWHSLDFDGTARKVPLRLKGQPGPI